MSGRPPDLSLTSQSQSTPAEKLAEDEPAPRINAGWVVKRITPYVSVLGALALIVTLLVTMYFTSLDWQWITFFAGVLGAAVVSLGTRSVRVEWMIAQRNTQLAAAHQTLARESALRTGVEQALAGIRNDFGLLHDSLPAMLACVDLQRQLTYRNRAFERGLGAGVSRIEGRHLREIIGSVAYAAIEADLTSAFGGRVVHRDQLFKSNEGESFRLKMQYLPTFDTVGTVARVFLLATDITELVDVAVAVNVVRAADVRAVESAPPSTDSVAERDADAARLRNALAADEFCLFYQTIEPVDVHEVVAPFREILLRLKVEEESMLPPGSFLPVAEEYGMMPDLDRWVTRHLLGWIRVDAARLHATYSINLSAQTMADSEFPAFVSQALRDFGLPGSLLCFELQEADLQHWSSDAIRLVNQLQPEGCRFAICGFRGNHASFDLLRRVPVHFLKIDGSLILSIQRSAIDMARVKSIHRVAKAIGVSTIAECVEDDDTLAQLRIIGVDFAQGFGISRPQDLGQITAPMPPEAGTVSAPRHTSTPMAAE